MKRFMVPCDFGGRKAPFPIYVGEPKPDTHPLHNQSWWLSSERGGSIPQEVMDSFEKLHTIAKDNNVSFEELCMYAMGEALGGSASGGTASDDTDSQPQAVTAQDTAPAQFTEDAALETGEDAQTRLQANHAQDHEPNPNQ